MMNHKIAYALVPILFLGSLFLSGCFPAAEQPQQDDNQEAPTAVVVTVPADEQTETITCTDDNTGASLTYAEALSIAQTSSCMAEGQLKETNSCNSWTGTWWIDLDAEKPGCNPACVVDLNSRTAEINWRCTGVLPPDDAQAPALEDLVTATSEITQEVVLKDVAYQNVHFSYPETLAANVSGISVPDEPFLILEGNTIPEHLEFTFDEYILPEAFHRPAIYIYPVQDFIEGNEVAAREIPRLRQLLVDKPAKPEGSIPFLPLVNAGEMMRSQMAYLNFQGGEGVRYLTQYGQAYLPINNREMFYSFQGLTADGRYYVAIVLPVSHPDLPADETEIPGGDAEAFINDYEAYAQGVATQLDAQPDDSFLPDLGQIDALVTSIEIVGDLNQSIVYDYSDWQTYTNETFGYTVQVPGDVGILEAPDGSGVSFEGPLVDNEHWPMLSISHYASDFYRPDKGADVRDWVLGHGIPHDDIGLEAELAGLPVLHLVNSATPETYSYDEYYLINDRQLFRIMLLHAVSKEDWGLYNQFLDSLSFPNLVKEEGPMDGAWQGTVGRYPPGYQSEYYFDRADGELFILSGADSQIEQQIAEAAWPGAPSAIWAEQSEIPDMVVVNRIEQVAEPPIDSRQLSYFANPTVSSQLPADRLGIYHAWSAIDGNPKTPWCEGVEGMGAGQWIRLEFPGPIEVTHLTVSNGYNYNDDIYYKNNRVRDATLVFSGEEVVWQFDDASLPQTAVLARAPGPNILTTFVQIRINDVYPGSTYDDTCLGEIEVWGRPQ